MTLGDACGVAPFGAGGGDPGDCRDASTAARALCGAGPFPDLTGSTTFSPGVTCLNNINTTKATFTAPGNYILRVQANDDSGDGGGGFQCCWTNAHVAVTVKPAGETR